MIQRINVADKQYEIKRAFKRQPESDPIDEPKILEIKNSLGYDAMIKNDQFYFICNEITDVEFIETKFEHNETVKI